MKCNNIAIFGWKSKSSVKNKPRILFSVNNIEKLGDVDYGKWIISHTEVCGGEIESQIELEFIPYYGGSDANIEVRFKCKKCGHEYAGDYGLPYDVDSLNKFLTEAIAKL